MFIDELEARRLLAAGQTDPYFGDSGTVAGGQQLLVARDGRILAVSQLDAGVLTIKRFGADGQLDPNYSFTLQTSERFRPSGPAALDSRGRLFVSADDKIYCIGTNGKLDRSFGSRGAINSPLEGSVNDLLVQRDDKLVVAGAQRMRTTENDDTGQPYFATASGVVRLTADGKRDTTFGPKGVRLLSEFSTYGTQSIEGYAVIDVEQDLQGRLLVMREEVFGADFNDYITTDTTVILSRLNPDGTADIALQDEENATSFSYRRTVGSFHSNENRGREPFAFTIDPAGRFLVLFRKGDLDLGATSGVLRLLPTGERDLTFSGDGFADTFQASADVAEVVTAIGLADATTVVGVNFGALNGFPAANAVTRLNADGSFDATYGIGGAVPVSSVDRVVELAVAQDGSILSNERRVEDGGVVVNTFSQRWRYDGPAAVLNAKTLTIATRSQNLDVVYRDDEALNLTSFDKLDLRITGPNGYVKYARFDSVVSSENGNGRVVARYKLAAPSGGWTNGAYTVRLRQSQVRDNDGNANAARTLGTFAVQAPVAATTGSSVAQAFSRVKLELDELK